MKLDCSEAYVKGLRYHNTTSMSNTADKLAACVGPALRRFPERICLRTEIMSLFYHYLSSHS